MEKKDIFISYKTEEFEEANWVRSTLETNGITCWMAPMCIPGGSSYAEEIPKAIQNCKVFVLILSEKCQLSKWVPKEVDQAINAGKIIMPFMMENCPLKKDFDFYLTNVQRYEAYRSKEQAMGKMVSEIKAIIGEKKTVIEGENSQEDVEQQPKQEETKASEPVTKQQKAEEPKKEKAVKKEVKKPKADKKKGSQRAKGKIFGIVALSSVLAVVLIVVGIIMLIKLNQVEIAGETFKKSDYWIELTDKTVTNQDIETISEMDVGSLEFTNCQITATNLELLSNLEIATFSFPGCDVSTEQLSSIDYSTWESAYHVDLSNNKKIDNVAFLSPLKDSLTYINLSGTSIKNLDDLKGFTKLNTVWFNDLKINTLDGLENCIYLKEIHAQNCNLSSLKGLKNTTVLETVDFDNNILTQFDLQVLASSAKTLKMLSVASNSLTSLGDLSECVNLIGLKVDNNFLSGLKELEKITGLTQLSASKNRISSVEGLTGKTFSYLNLSFNQISDLAVENEGLKFGERAQVILSHNNLQSFTLSEEIKYANVQLHSQSVPVVNADVLYTLDANYVSFDYMEALDYSKIGANNYFEVMVVKCPQNKQVAVENALGYKFKNLTAEEIDKTVVDITPEWIKN